MFQLIFAERFFCDSEFIKWISCRLSMFPPSFPQKERRNLRFRTHHSPPTRLIINLLLAKEERNEITHPGSRLHFTAVNKSLSRALSI